jgi:hypothetical protein
MKKLKFNTEDSKFGLTEATGFVWYTKKGIHIEFQVSDTIIDAYKTDISEVFIPYHCIEDIEYKSAWFAGGDICISLNTLKGFSELLFLDENELILSLERKQRTKGKEFVVNLKLEKVGYVIDELDKKRFEIP